MKDCVVLSLERRDSLIHGSDGKEVPFGRAVLAVRNRCDRDAEVVLRVSLGQEGGTVQVVSQAVAPEGKLLVPQGGSVSRDVFDVLLPAHPGTSSKVHMFGYRAVLNWRFELIASAAYRLQGEPTELEVPASRWVFSWSVPDQASRAVVLAIEDVKE